MIILSAVGMTHSAVTSALLEDKPWTENERNETNSDLWRDADWNSWHQPFWTDATKSLICSYCSADIWTWWFLEFLCDTFSGQSDNSKLWHFQAAWQPKCFGGKSLLCEEALFFAPSWVHLSIHTQIRWRSLSKHTCRLPQTAGAGT